MEEITKQDWLEWRANPVTQSMFSYINEQMNNEMWDLAQNAGKNQHQDSTASGRITAYGDLFNWTPELPVEDVPEEEEND